ncbi:MAG: HAMP domain-containing protein [Proteobacteria bacterium]|nr:HAMP domain-containing protein [Pseudomonadota bacterium]
MDRVINKCFECHHSEPVMKKLTDLNIQAEKYKDALSRVLTISANVIRLEAEEDIAFRTGQELIEKVNTMIALTRMRLREKTQSTLREIANTKFMLFILVAIGPPLAVGLAFVFIRGLTEPVNVLRNATRRLKGGDLDYRIEGLEDEFGEVAESLNEMAGSLKEQMHRMQRAEQMTVVGEMATGLAHEIKNPLAGIKASMEVLSQEPTFTEEDKAVLSQVIDEVKRIESLMKGLLNFAKPPHLQFTTVDVNEILDTAIAFSLTYPSFSSNNSKAVDIKRDYDDHLPATMADPIQLQQVFLNLLLNAGDATPDGGTVTVRTSHDPMAHSIRIEISDTGPGIDEGLTDKIFRPFFTTKPKGTGLGLAISKQLVERHGGDIRSSNNPGCGTAFTIVLPLKKSEGVQIP